MNQQEKIATVISKCWDDESFKNEFVSNPHATYKKVIGEELVLPAGKELKVVDQTNEHYMYFNIPGEPNLDELELTDEQLELVAGGVLPIILTIASAWWIGGGATVGVGIGIASTID